MSIIEESTLIHWNYFLPIEEDLLNISRYIEFSEPNFQTYSIELARILLVASSEIDVVAKQLCAKLEPGSSANRITDYQAILTRNIAILPEVVATIPRFELTLKPWSNWQRGNVPLWWNAYNNVKHQRHTHFSDANLKNTINAAAGLFTLLLFYYRTEAEEGSLYPNPQLFRVGFPFEMDSIFLDKEKFHTGNFVYKISVGS